MKKEQIEKIAELRKIGIGYRSIAAAMGLSRDAVRYHSKVLGLDGYADDVKKNPNQEQSSKEFCKNCKDPINGDRKSGRRRTYCSSICKKEWESDNPCYYDHDCYYCGKQFKSRAVAANFCSHKCYIRNRFYRKEDLKEIMTYLEKDLPVPNAPGWIKAFILGDNDRGIGPLNK